MKLYELQDQLVQIDAILEQNTNEETQEILESAKDEVLQQIDGKIENILDYINDCKSRCDQLKENEQRLAAKRKILENKAEYLRNMLMWYMETNNKTKESFGNWDITVAKTAGKVVLDINEESLPSWCKKQTWSVDKTVLKAQMIEGKAYIEGEDGNPLLIAHLEEGKSIRIK
ncbi:MAG: siphovirus Gp157 family protein [Bacteroidales bacterium]|nr:siphovirus Gp157 family protein [Bacteroidales bacterium]